MGYNSFSPVVYYPLETRNSFSLQNGVLGVIVNGNDKFREKLHPLVRVK